jgi:ABC-type multidrug transport system permease subunit
LSLSETKTLNVKFLKDILIIATMKSIPDLRKQPLTLIIVTLLSFMPLFFTSFFGGQVDYALLGGMVCSIGLIGLVSAIQDITMDRHEKMREMIVAMPVHPVSYSLGVATSKLLYAAPGFIIFLVMTTTMGILPLSAVGWSVISVFLCWAALSSIGFMVSTYLRKASANTLTNVSTILGITLIFLPPVFYSEQLWGAYAGISIVFPTSNAASLIRAYAGLSEQSSEMILLRWLVLIATTVISLIAVSLKAKWREE